jgi:translation initiation factor IF-3
LIRNPLSGEAIGGFVIKGDFRINEQIRVKQVRLIDENGGQVGVVNTEDARKMALERAVDLVEVAPEANPPVCKLLNFGKFKYQLKKKSHQAKRKQHKQQLKELRLRPITEEHDLMTKVKHAREFLSNGDKVLFNMVFKGREVVHRDIGFTILNRFIKELEDICKVEKGVSTEGPRLTLTLMPKQAPPPA